MIMRSLLTRRRWKYASRQPRFVRFTLSYAGVGALLCSMAILLLSSCTLFPAPVRSGTPEPGSGTASTEDTPTSIIPLSPTNTVTGTKINLQIVGSCPSSINWDKLVGTKGGVNKVQTVTCGTFENGALAALVNVRYYSSDARLDFAVYDNLYGTPTRRFGVQGLTGGDAKISPTNTIITAENPGNDPFGPSVFKEYQWNGSTYAQILFPGIYPDMTHYQAEQDQANINAQQLQITATPNAKLNAWQNSAFSVVNRMAQDIFHWPGTQLQNTVSAYNSRLGLYTIQTANLGPGGGGFITNLFRLDDLTTNIFEVKSVTSIDGTALLTSPVSGAQLRSPVKVAGSYQSTGTILGRVALYSDTFFTVGDTNAIKGSASSGFASFGPSVSYHLSTRGQQEGLVVFYASNQNNVSFSNQVVVAKVFFAA